MYIYGIISKIVVIEMCSCFVLGSMLLFVNRNSKLSNRDRLLFEFELR